MQTIQTYGRFKPEDMPSEVIAKPVIYKVFEHAEATPDALAVVAFAGSGREIRRTYAELCYDVQCLADSLRGIGITQGDRIGIFTDNSNAYQALVSILASNLMGAVFVPLNARYVERELKDAMLRAQCRAIVIAPELAPTLKRIQAELPDLRHVIHLSRDNSEDLSFDALLATGDPSASKWPHLNPSDVSEIMFTSGTTGSPKAVVMTHGRTAASAHIYKTMLELKAEDRLHSFFPIFTTASTKCLILPILAAGGAAIIDPDMDIPSIVARMVRERSSIYYAVPAFYIFLLEHAHTQPVDLPDMRLFMYGGAAMPLKPIEDITKTFPHVSMGQTLGSTETGATGSILYPEFALSKLGSVGKAFPYTEVKLVNDQGNEVGTNEPGEFAVRSPAVFQEYLDDPESSRETLKDGWVMMGDIGQRDADGFYFHVDRKKDIIIRGGHNIGSMEIEGVIYKYPGVAEVAAVAVPHPKLGEDVFVFVVQTEGQSVDEEALLEYCRENLSDYKVPRHIAFIPEMPRNPMGKIVKTQLRERAKELM